MSKNALFGVRYNFGCSAAGSFCTTQPNQLILSINWLSPTRLKEKEPPQNMLGKHHNTGKMERDLLLGGGKLDRLNVFSNIYSVRNRVDNLIYIVFIYICIYYTTDID